MYVINEYDFPIKIWGEKMNEDSGCMEQAKNLSRLPFAHKWVALMPDTHAGKGMPIGGVIACEGQVIPNAVGVDIGSDIYTTERAAERILRLIQSNA